jgi:hypothetical protein
MAEKNVTYSLHDMAEKNVTYSLHDIAEKNVHVVVIQQSLSHFNFSNIAILQN